jgi:hypothetical protein
MSWFISVPMILVSFYWAENAIIGFLVQIHACFFYHHYNNRIIGLHSTSLFFLKMMNDKSFTPLKNNKKINSSPDAIDSFFALISFCFFFVYINIYSTQAIVFF